jgi:hypothetical protein
MANFITLTDGQTGRSITINADFIVFYQPAGAGQTEMVLKGLQPFKVSNSSERIDEYLKSVVLPNTLPQ